MDTQRRGKKWKICAKSDLYLIMWRRWNRFNWKWHLCLAGWLSKMFATTNATGGLHIWPADAAAIAAGTWMMHVTPWKAIQLTDFKVTLLVNLHRILKDASKQMYTRIICSIWNLASFTFTLFFSPSKVFISLCLCVNVAIGSPLCGLRWV